MTCKAYLAGLAMAGLAAAWPAHAETFITSSGEQLEGTVLKAGGNTVTIKLAGRGMRQMPISEIREVKVPTESGSIVGTITAARSDGRYLLQTAQGLVSIKRGVIVPAADEAAPAYAAVPPEPAPASEPVPEPAPAAPPEAALAPPTAVPEVTPPPPQPSPPPPEIVTAVPEAQSDLPAAPDAEPVPAGAPDDSQDLKSQFRLFLAELSQQGDLASMGKDEIFQRYLEWQRARQVQQP